MHKIHELNNIRLLAAVVVVVSDLILTEVSLSFSLSLVITARAHAIYERNTRIPFHISFKLLN